MNENEWLDELNWSETFLSSRGMAGILAMKLSILGKMSMRRCEWAFSSLLSFAGSQSIRSAATVNSKNIQNIVVFRQEKLLLTQKSQEKTSLSYISHFLNFVKRSVTDFRLIIIIVLITSTTYLTAQLAFSYKWRFSLNKHYKNNLSPVQGRSCVGREKRCEKGEIKRVQALLDPLLHTLPHIDAVRVCSSILFFRFTLSKSHDSTFQEVITIKSHEFHSIESFPRAYREKNLNHCIASGSLFFAGQSIMYKLCKNLELATLMNRLTACRKEGGENSAVE